MSEIARHPVGVEHAVTGNSDKRAALVAEC